MGIKLLLAIAALTLPLVLRARELGPFCSIDWGLMGKGETEITFNLCCKTTGGWVGFGISPNGGMKGADMVVIEFKNGTGHLEDMHGDGKDKRPLKDKHNDYHLLKSSRNKTHITASFSRALSTCDEKEDVEITDDTLKLIWALGSTETLGYHNDSRGSIVVNLLDKKMSQLPNRNNYLRFEQSVVLNGNDTMYWCKIHKSPFQVKHHIIGYELFFGSNESRKHAHHASLLRCTAPEGENVSYFRQFEGKEYDCYYSEKYYPTEHCKFFEFQWTYGGTITTFPENAGVPIGEEPEAYYLTMFHLNNPKNETGTQFSVGFDLFYTNESRKLDVGFLQLGINSSKGFALTIPPNATDYSLSSHCPMECTSVLPKEGIKAFMYLLHFHLSGRKMRIRHFRGEEELPWLAKDDNYDTNYQMSRMIRNPVRILPKDHLAVECEFETKSLKGVTVIGGRSIHDEMCQAFVMYYPRVKEINRCGSSFPQDKLLKFMGIETIVSEKAGNNPTVTSPLSMQNKKYTDVVSTMVNWTTEMRKKYQNLTSGGDQVAECSGKAVESRYPKIKKKYKPFNKCDKKAKGSGNRIEDIRLFSIIMSFIGTTFYLRV